MTDPKMGLIERTLCRLLKFQDIRDEETGELYLRRFFINPTRKNQGYSRIYLHKFYRGDQDRHPHDHPWGFTSLILKGGYHEETPCGCSWGGCVKLKWYRPLSLLRRPATWRHRVVIAEGHTAWTLVFTGPKERSWGFFTEKGFCPWRSYSKGVCWCEEEKVA